MTIDPENQYEKKNVDHQKREVEASDVDSSVDWEKISEMLLHTDEAERGQQIAQLSLLYEEHHRKGGGWYAGERRIFTIEGVDFPMRWILPGTLFLKESYQEKTPFLYKLFPFLEKKTSAPKTVNVLSVPIVKGFWMAESPTTSAQFQPLVFWHHLPSLSQKEDTPVIGVSWYEAAYFVNVLRSLSEQELCFEHRVAPKYSKEILDTDIVDPLPLIDTLHGRVDYEALSGWKLPTEKEWLYACQGGGDTPFYGCLDEIAWHKENNEEGELKRVNQKKPNPFGLFDMLGNMVEWVYDACEPKYVCRNMDGRLVECFKRSIGDELYLAKAKDYRDLLSCTPADFRGPKQGFRVIKAL